ncbi:hypothetical protein CTAYLR_003971 [Chrysophaeum taylorii]|uniref:Exostosin GT47 domain-containing protein n=1 Tax=Chrysophaeum taylorii TaxID=2483200 RepID=A0AAD7UER1_9STRA|nr:hypothetical protein CTAYLR_003971 [Chrysophaeum taylorii]
MRWWWWWWVFGVGAAGDKYTRCIVAVSAAAANGSSACESERVCEASPPRSCLLSRIPWQSPERAVECCLECCVMYWEAVLGLSRVREAWRIIRGLEDEEVVLKTRLEWKDRVAFELSQLLLNPQLSLQVEIHKIRKKHPGLLATTPLDIGLITTTNNVGIARTYKTAPIHRLVKNCSVLNFGDSPLVDFKTLQVKAPELLRWPRGGRIFAANANTRSLVDPANPHRDKVMITGHSASRRMHLLLGQKVTTTTTERSTFFLCCCMTSGSNRGGRVERALQMQPELCENFNPDDGFGHVDADVYADRLLDSKIVWSPRGHGLSCFRDHEALLAGAAVVLDNYVGLDGFEGVDADPGRFPSWDPLVPVIWVPLDASKCKIHSTCARPTRNITKSWLEEQYKKIHNQREKLDLKRAYWPFWLYHIFAHLEPRYEDEVDVSPPPKKKKKKKKKTAAAAAADIKKKNRKKNPFSSASSPSSWLWWW